MALLTARDVTIWLQHLANAFAAAATDLARLDEQVGDGDHGETMRRAFHAAARRARTDQADTVQGVLEAAAEAFMEAGGGASGPLMASVFVGLARASAGRETLQADVVAEGLQRSRDLVVRMGHCAPGDKTLLDALHPAARAAQEAAAHAHDPVGVWQAAADAAAHGRDATTELTGKAGRAAWIEGKGRGVTDPGATSMALLLDHAARAAAGEQELVSPDAEDNMDAVTGASAVGPDPRAAMLAGKFLNDPADLVNEMIEGFVQAYPDRVRRLKGTNIVVRARSKAPGHVGLVIGNGSGHEPIAMGWVGTGLLDANAVGPVFTAPGPVAIARAITEADRGAGVLLLISHHAGDRIGGEMAAEMARVAGHDVETLLMYDDVASAPKGREAERRGAPGTAFIYKIVGAALEEGIELTEAKALGERIRDATRTLAVAVAPGTSPITGQAMFSLPEGEAFIGMGVHGEPGFARMPAHPLDAICARIVDGLIEDGGYESGETVSVFVNGSGGTSLMELLAVARSVFAHLREVGIHYVAPLIGSYVTTQETKGFSVSLCRLRVDDRQRWTAPSDAPFFHL